MPLICQHHLENGTLDLQSAYKQAYSLDLAPCNTDAFAPHSAHTAAVVNPWTLEEDSLAGVKKKSVPDDSSAPFERSALAATYTTIKKCFYCGGPSHVCNRCLAHEATCNKCAKKGRFARVCKSRTLSGSMATVFSPHVLATITNIPQGLTACNFSNC